MGSSMRSAICGSTCRSERKRVEALCAASDTRMIFGFIVYSITQVRYARREMQWVPSSHWMLTEGMEVESHSPSVEFCKRYADFLIAHQMKSGAIPTFFKSDTMRPDQVLMRGAETACSGMFLAHPYIVTREEKYLRAAQAAEGFIADEVVPTNKWQDHETFR